MAHHRFKRIVDLRTPPRRTAFCLTKDVPFEKMQRSVGEVREQVGRLFIDELHPNARLICNGVSGNKSELGFLCRIIFADYAGDRSRYHVGGTMRYFSKRGWR